MMDLLDAVSGLFASECCLMAAILAFVVLITVKTAFDFSNKQTSMIAEVIKEIKK